MKYHTAKTFNAQDAELTAAAKLAYGGAIFLTPQTERVIDMRLGFCERRLVAIDADNVAKVDDLDTMKGPSRREMAALEAELRIEAALEAEAEMKNVNAA